MNTIKDIIEELKTRRDWETTEEIEQWFEEKLYCVRNEAIQEIIDELEDLKLYR